MLYKKALFVLATAVSLGCVPMATNALAAGHTGERTGGGHSLSGHATADLARGGHAMGGPARGGRAPAGYARSRSGSAGYSRGGRFARYGGGPIYGAPIYDSCAGYGRGYGYRYGYGPGYGTDYSGCAGYGVPFVGGMIDGIIGGY